MMSKWQTKKLSKVTEKIFSGGTPATTNKAYWNGDINWLSSGETSNRFIFDTIQKISLLGVENSSTKLALQWDTVIASAGQGKTRGQTALLKVDSYINQSIIALRANRNEITPLWLFYNLSNRYSELRNISDSHSSRGSLTTALLKDLEISFPSINEQDKITGILFAIDNKIQLNTQTNQTLEQIAQAIFKHWFIDFAPVHAKANALARGETIEQAELAAMACLSGKTVEKITALKTQDPTAYHQLQQTAAAFPGEFVETEMGEVPKGWEVKKVKDIAKFIKGKKPKNLSENQQEGLLPYITMATLSGKNISFASPEGMIIADKLDILISMDGSAGNITIGYKGIVGSTFAKINLTGRKYISFFYQFMKNKEEDIKANTTGTSVPHTDKERVLNYSITIPNDDLINYFSKVHLDLLEKILLNKNENNTLENLRDTLLPKLLNGEIEL